ncbi:MAG TPA: hypothetical protein VMW74_06340 [Nitrosopumilaceae archaeon]|nr:hypothetical protein [Nitrosopumilaceae archaeon]
MTIHYGFVDIAIKQEVRDMLREIKGSKSYSRFIEELLEMTSMRDNSSKNECTDFVFQNYLE